MAITGYIAMTAAEFFAQEPLPDHPGWMACHFSDYSTGLTNFPKALPPGAMVIVNDRMPIQGHDPEYIRQQLISLWEQMQPDCFLLDLQRPGNKQTEDLVSALAGKLPCPVGVSQLYAKNLDCPVFLPAPPIDCPLKAHLAPWQGREVWLEIATDAQCAKITSTGCSFSPADIRDMDTLPHRDTAVHCRYRVDVEKDRATFHLQRSGPELQALLQEAEDLGVTLAVGLFQQLGRDFFKK